MALYYNLVFSLLVTEMALFTILSLPLPSKIRKPLITTVSTPFKSKEFNVALKCILAFVLLLFIDSVNRVNHINEELKSLTTPGAGATQSALLSDRSEILARKFYAQRNLYLTGFTLFLTLIVSRTYSLVAELLTLKEEVRENPDALETNQEYVKLQKELKEKCEKIEILEQQTLSLSKDYENLDSEFDLKNKSSAEKKKD